MNVARLESTLAFNDVAFTQGIERAEKRAQTFAGRVETSFQGLFKRTPGRRAERALGGLIGDISTGNAAQGIAMFASRLTGLGLAAGVGIGVAVELFSKLHESVTEVRKAHDDLDKQMSHPLNLTSIEGLGKAIDNLREKQGTFTHGASNYLYDLTHGQDLGKSRNTEDTEIGVAIAKRQEAEKARGRNELVRANVLAGLESDPQRKALAELRFKFDDRRKELMSNPDKGSAARLKALDVEQDVAEKNLKAQKKASDYKLDAEEKIQNLIAKGLSKEDEKKLRAVTELKGIDAEIANETDPKALRKLNITKTAKENEIRGFGQSSTEKENPFQFGTLSARDFERSQESAKFNSQFAGFGMTQEQKDLKGPAAPNAEVVAAVNQVAEVVKSTMKEYWGSK